MSETQPPSTATQAAEPAVPAKSAPGSSAKIHRVCIGCNNMFEVTMENYEAKHCPACRKS